MSHTPKSETSTANQPDVKEALEEAGEHKSKKAEKKPAKRINRDEKLIAKVRSDLRDKIVLPKQTRLWLANAMDDKSNSELKLVASQRKNGRSELDFLEVGIRRMYAGEFVASCLQIGVPKACALYSADRKYGCGEATIDKAYKEFRLAGAKGTIRPELHKECGLREDQIQAFNDKWEAFIATHEPEPLPEYETTEEDWLQDTEWFIDRLAAKFCDAIVGELADKSSALLGQGMAKALTSHPPGCRTSDMLAYVSQTLAQQFLEKMGAQFSEKIATHLTSVPTTK